MSLPGIRRKRHLRGDDFRYAFRVEVLEDPDNPRGGRVPRDLTGWTFVAPSAPAGHGVTEPVALGADGRVVIEVNDLGAADPELEAVRFDVKLTDPDGFEQTYVRLHVDVDD